MLRLGPGRSFRARTARLQAALSRALRGGMAENTGGVLAAMAAGDKSHLSSALRSAYRGAGLSHVLVVSGMHVSILCGDILSVLLPKALTHTATAARRTEGVKPVTPISTSASRHPDDRRQQLCGVGYRF